jgi:general secretion pathway protein D
VQITPAQSSQKTGSTFQMVVNVADVKDLYGMQLPVTYDASKLTLINVDTENKSSLNLLGRDGQAVALAHRDNGNGGVAIALSRPPKTAGMNGSGMVCVLTFQAKAPGDALVAISQPTILNSQQDVSRATGSQAIVHVQ